LLDKVFRDQFPFLVDETIALIGKAFFFPLYKNHLDSDG
jgi:hypothetical protein